MPTPSNYKYSLTSSMLKHNCAACNALETSLSSKTTLHWQQNAKRCRKMESVLRHVDACVCTDILHSQSHHHCRGSLILTPIIACWYDVILTSRLCLRVGCYKIPFFLEIMRRALYKHIFRAYVPLIILTCFRGILKTISFPKRNGTTNQSLVTISKPYIDE